MPAKIVVVGDPKAGMATFVGSVSDIAPLTVESEVIGADGHMPAKPTTVAAVFGRVSIRDDLTLFLFGTSGQHSFWPMWDELARGAIGAGVLIDSRRPADSLGPVDFFAERGLPFVLGVYGAGGAPAADVSSVRAAMGIGADVPAVPCDVRDPRSVRQMLLTLVEHAVRRRTHAAAEPAAQAVGG